MRHIVEDEPGQFELSLLYGNKSENEILLREELERWDQNGDVKVNFTVDQPSETWTGFKGYLTSEMIRKSIPPPSEDHLVINCGPKAMNDLSCRILKSLGHKEDNIFNYRPTN